MEVSEYKDGFLDGSCKTYDEEGNIKTECLYKQNLIVGDKIAYHPNGTIAMVSPYQNGKANGTTKKYSTTGQLQEEWVFEDGQLKAKKDFTLGK